MFDRRDLDAAVAARVIGEEEAARLRAFLDRRAYREGVAGDPESLRFLANFNDVFITIGLVVLLGGVYAVSVVTFPPSPANLGPGVALTLLPVVGLAWLLSEYFAGHRRLLLPSMALALAVCLGAGAIAAALVGGRELAESTSLTRAFFALGSLGVSGAAAVAGAAALYFFRFRLPFSLAILALGLALMAYVGVSVFGDTGMVIGGALSFLIGLATLAVGIGFDMSDPERLHRRSDYAFWLHLAAAPQIMLGLRGLLSGAGFVPDGSGEAIGLLLALFAFGILSLALNRRALIVSGVLTFATALAVVLDDLGGPAAMLYTPLIVGAAVIIVGAGWSTARRGVLALLPRGGLFDRLFPPEPLRPA